MRSAHLILLFLLLTLVGPEVVSAHRSGCHRWHTCPSDTGSYVMVTGGSDTTTYTGTSTYTGGTSSGTSTYVAPAPAAPAGMSFCGKGYCDPKVNWKTYDDDTTFAPYWGPNGGMPVFGRAKTKAYINKHGFLAQIFERNRIEYHPELAWPYNHQLGLLGEERLLQLGRVWQNESGADAAAGCLYFPETRHNVCGAFKKYWTTHGIQLDNKRAITYAESLALFGYPITEAVMEKGTDGVMRTTQWFQRARFEDHGDQGVMLGLLGNEVFQ